MKDEGVTAGDVMSGMMFCCVMFGALMLDYSPMVGLVMIAVGIAPVLLALAVIGLGRVCTWAGGLWRRYIDYCREVDE